MEKDALYLLQQTLEVCGRRRTTVSSPLGNTQLLCTFTVVYIHYQVHCIILRRTKLCTFGKTPNTFQCFYVITVESNTIVKFKPK